MYCVCRDVHNIRCMAGEKSGSKHPWLPPICFFLYNPFCKNLSTRCHHLLVEVPWPWNIGIMKYCLPQCNRKSFFLGCSENKQTMVIVQCLLISSLTYLFSCHGTVCEGSVTVIKQLASFDNSLSKNCKETQQRTKNSDTINKAETWSLGFYTIEHSEEWADLLQYSSRR